MGIGGDKEAGTRDEHLIDSPLSGRMGPTEAQTVAAVPRIRVVLASTAPPGSTKSGKGGED